METLVLENACVIVAMRELLDDPSWGPYELALIIKEHNGLPWEMNADLANYAPVKVLDIGQDITCWPESWAITIGDERTMFDKEKLIISYETTPGRAHMECLTVEEFISRRIQRVIGMIIKK